MCERFSDAVAALRGAVSSLDVSRLAGVDAARLVEMASEGERLCAAARTLAAGRVADTGEWRASGAKTAAQWLAWRTQGTLSQAITSVWTAHHLREVPATGCVRGGAVVKVIERDGVDVRRIAHRRRAIPTHLRTALEARDPTWWCRAATCAWAWRSIM